MAKISECIPGATFAHWTVVGPSERAYHIEARCDCGTVKAVQVGNLGGKSQSCGCSGRRHGMTNTTEYNIWVGMKQRCLNPKHEHFADYGGRGITICDRWRHSFEAFFEDMGSRPSKNHTLDRIDNDGNYEPANCAWRTWKEQGRNKRPQLRDTCIKGHPRTPENVRTSNGRRTCRVCDRERGAEERAAERLSRESKGVVPGRRQSRRRGELSNFAKVTAVQVDFIRKAYAAGLSQAEIAAAFGITQSAVSTIVLRKAWRHVPDDVTVGLEPSDA